MEFEVVKVKKLAWWRTKRLEVTLRDDKGKLHTVRVMEWLTEGFLLSDIEHELKKELGLLEPKPNWTKQLLKKKISIEK